MTSEIRDLTYVECFAAIKELLPTRTFALEAQAWQQEDSSELSGVRYRMKWQIWHAGLSMHFSAPTARGALENLRDYIGFSDEEVIGAVGAVGACEAS
tara:strand:- start:4 stop:297 length:294 start_codon:yes stop_codon:yes gene_type:complete